jgi:hypothetical protein
MKNKLLLTTAIASGMMISTAAISDVKVSGDIEQTYRSVSYDLAGSKIQGGAGLGAETNVAITYTGSLDNGLSIKAGSVLEDGVADTEFLTIGGETVSITFGQDTGNNLSSTVVPHISDQDGTLYGAANSGTAPKFKNQYGSIAHDKRHVSLDAKAAGGTFTVRYSPSTDSNRASDSGIDTSGGSAVEVLYAGSLGVEGLKVQVGMETDYQENESGTTDDAKLTKIGASYNFGQVTVGADRMVYDSGATSNSDTTMDRIAAVFAASDQVRVGARYTKTDVDGTTADEKMKTLEIGYNLGGLGIELSVGQVENVGAASANGDADV